MATETVQDLPIWAQRLIDRLRQENTDHRHRTKRLVSKLEAANAARIAQLPESKRSLAPTSYTAEQLSDWLDANETKLV